MAAKNIVVFLGSTREGRMGEKVANYVGKILKKNGMSVKIFGTIFFSITHVQNTFNYNLDLNYRSS